MGAARTLIRSTLRALGRAYPLYSGAGKIHGCFRGDRFAPRDEWVTTTLRNGARVWVNPSDFAGLYVYYTGGIDRKLLWLLKRILRTGDTFLDIGANIGIASIYASDIVGPAGSVHAFEPQADLAQKIIASAELNGYENLHAHPAGLSSKDETVIMTMPAGDRTSASISRACPSGESVTVELLSAANFLPTLNLSQIRLVKIDVEGHEFTVLSSAETFFDQCMPEAFAFESNVEQRNIPFGKRPVVAWLHERGFKFVGVPKVLWPMRLAEMTTRMNESTECPYEDFLAYRTDDIENSIRNYIRG